MEEQLGHRLGIQEAEVEALRQELAAAQERADAAEQREEADAGGKTARLLEEMEGFMEEKLAAEARAQAMAAELSELRELVKNADERAAQEQGMLMQAAQQRMKAVEEVKFYSLIFSWRVQGKCFCFSGECGKRFCVRELLVGEG